MCKRLCLVQGSPSACLWHWCMFGFSGQPMSSTGLLFSQSVIHTNTVVFNYCFFKSLYKPKKLLLAVRLFCLNGPYGEGLLLQQSELQMLLSGNA